MCAVRVSMVGYGRHVYVGVYRQRANIANTNCDSMPKCQIADGDIGFLFSHMYLYAGHTYSRAWCIRILHLC